MKIHQKRFWIAEKSKSWLVHFRSIESDKPRSNGEDRTDQTILSGCRAHAIPKFRGQHLFVGSGVIEAGCKTVVAFPSQRSGCSGTVRGANAILALRCCHLKCGLKLLGGTPGSLTSTVIVHPQCGRDENWHDENARRAAARRRPYWNWGSVSAQCRWIPSGSSKRRLIQDVLFRS